jgi:hypothetical protein
MRIGLYGLVIFLAGIAPGLIQHGRPLPHSGRNIAQPIAAYSAPAEKPALLSLLARWKEA